MLLKTIAATADISNNSTVNLTVSSQINTTAATELENDVIYICGRHSDICRCDDYDLHCDSSMEPLNSTNLKRDNSSFYIRYDFKTARIKVSTDMIKKGRILPENEHTIERFSFSFSKIGSIEDGAFDNFVKLRSLNFANCNISSINNRIFTKAVGKTLNSLDLNYHSFVKLETDAFKYLTNLTSLNLENNDLEDFLTNKGMLPESLKELNLEFCKIVNLPDDIFSNLKNLETLSFIGNPLTTIPKAINSLQNLNYLKLDFTKIVVLSFGGIKTLGNLTTLDLSNIYTLEYIDSFAFCSFPNLTTLDLSNNRNLKSIHENAFGSFIGHFVTKLQDLKIKNCNLTVLPENLLPWENIKSVSISPNPFTCNCSMAWLINDFVNPKPKYFKNFHGELPRCSSPPELEGQSFQDIAGTVCFETNAIVDNRIIVCDKDDKDSPCNCKNHELSCKYWSVDPPTFLSLNLKIKDSKYTLKKISFAYYPIYTLRKGKIMRGHEKTIEEIDLQATRTEKIENGTFDDFTSLKILRITRHSLKMIDENFLTESLGNTLIELNLGDNFSYYHNNISMTAFKYMKKLEKLNLEWGSLTPIKKELFSESLKNLKSLTLKAYVKELDDDLFDNLVNLEELYLNYCSLTSVPTALNALSNLQILDISRTDIVTFDTQNLTTVFPDMRILNMKSIYSLTSIEDCAFCPFPNLEKIDLTSSKVQFIHENAFGYATAILNDTINKEFNGTSSKLKQFAARDCKLSTLPENLLPWDTVEEIKINDNPFICNCSMAWLINDFAKGCSKYTPNVQDDYYYPLKCAGPFALKGKSFEEISLKNCSTYFKTNATFEESENCTLEFKRKQQNKGFEDFVYYPRTYQHSYSDSDSNSNHISFIILFVIICAIVIIIGAVAFYFHRRKQIAVTSTSVQKAIDKLNVDMSMSTL